MHDLDHGRELPDEARIEVDVYLDDDDDEIPVELDDCEVVPETSAPTLGLKTPARPPRP